MKIEIQPDALRQMLFLDPNQSSKFNVSYCEGDGCSSYRILSNVNKMEIYDYISKYDNFRAIWTISKAGI